MAKRFLKCRIGNYEVEIRDYRYKSRPPVSVHISGTVDGECKNGFGEPCYFYKAAEAMSIPKGLEQAREIITKQREGR